MEWTTQQREAIEYRNNNVLLAAAAGSGKTAVLVQRVIEMIEKDKVSVNEMLVLTFTDAAAGEMREKIKKAIASALRKNPGDEHLQKQRLLMHSSSISTVHSFCMNTLKSNIYLTNLPVDFSLISETESAIMIQETLTEILERFYKRIDKDTSFADLVTGYGGIKNDSNLREMILNLHKFSRSMAYPSRWLNDAIGVYKTVAKTGKLPDGRIKIRQKAFVEQIRREIAETYVQIAEIIENELFEDHPYVDFINDEAATLDRIFSHIDGEDYASVHDELMSFEFPRMKTGLTKKAGEEIVQIQERIKALRNVAKNTYGDLKQCFSADEAEMLNRIKLTYPMLRTLKNIVMMLERRFSRKKRGKNFLDFNDLEHEMLNIISPKNGEPSEVAEKLRRKFKAILVDEYQDTNNIQDEIFRIVSRNDSNIFMVGDLKQSIYKFRNAVPKLFSEKYERYGADDREGHLIRLFRNFRSRESVVDTVNFLFERIMSPEVGNIEYDESEYLIQGADYYPEGAHKDDFETEFHVICKDVVDDEGEVLEAGDKTEVEARFVVMRIREMMRDGVQVYDKNLNAMRQLEFRDIVILVRNTRSTAPIIEKVLEESGIPVYTEVGHSYIGALEIQTVMAFLQVIDNPRQDIPLIAVLRSPVWDFSPEELGEIRCGKSGGCFYEALKYAAENGDNKAEKFVDELTRLREMAEHSGIDRIISYIYYDFGYYAYVGSLKHGEERQANLNLLLEHATTFERTKLSGLFGFMNFIETMRAEKKDLVPAKIFGEGANVVKIKSIHKSKGLEFPIVFLLDTAHQFNMKDASKAIIWDGEGGIGAGYVDNHMRIRYSTLPQLFVGMDMRADFMSEEMRLLYVALTRAREKLIITSTFRAGEKSWMAPVWDKEGRVSVSYVQNTITYRDWLVSAFMLHPDAKELREFCGISNEIVKFRPNFGMTVKVHENPDEFDVVWYDEEIKDDIVCANEEYDIEEIRKKFDFVYEREALSKLPVKMSVSEVKRMMAEDAEFVPLLESLKQKSIAEPDVVKGAEKGTVVHFVMQMLDPNKISSAEDVKAAVEKMKDERVISEAQAAAVDCDAVAKFFLSAVGQRLKSALRRETEFSFYTKVSADEILGNGVKDEILLQGTMDCFFVDKDGKCVLLDYKTDRVSNLSSLNDIAEKYRIQMKYYKKALGEILDTKVDECYLYFLDCGEFVEMND